MIISDKIYIKTTEVGNHLYELCSLFTYPNPEFYEKQRLRLSTHGVEKELSNYRLQGDPKNGQTLLLPRGGLSKVLSFYKEKNISYRVKEDTVSFPEIDVALIDTTIEPQQVQIIETLKKNGGGLAEASPGAGKSISILGLITEVKQPTLILVHEHRLRTQWEQEVKTRLTGTFKFGRYDGDKKIDGDIVIGLIQTVQKVMDTDPSWINNYGMLVIDECHRCPAPTFMKVLNNSKSKWRVGVTGTVKRKDGKHLLIYDVLGPVLLELGEKDLKHRITGFDFEIVNTNIRLELPSVSRWTGKGRELSIDITHALGVLTSSQERNALILSHIVKSIQEGYFPLVLSDRVEHCKYFSNALTELGYNIILLIGATRKKADWSTIRGDTSLECIIAQSSIASEGLDFPRLSALHLTCPSSNLPKIKQRIGRIRRYIEGKVMPKVYDYVDNLASYTDSYGNPQYIFKGGAYKRIKFYKQLQTDYDT